MLFYENYVRLCNLVNKSPSAVALEIGIAKPTVSRWKTGSIPNTETLLKVADYFGVSVSDLTREEKEKSSTPEGVELTKTQQQAWDLIQSMDDDSLRKFIAIAKAVMGV